MQRTRSTHLVTLVSLLSIPVLIVAVLAPGVASATAKPKALTGSCTGLSGNATGTVSVIGCSPSPNAPGTGTFNFTGATSGTSSISWSNGSKTSFTFNTKQILPTKTHKGASVPNPKFHCPAGDIIEVALKGKIPNSGGNTGLPTGDTGLKGAVKATICLDSAENLSLLAGTSFAL